MDVRSRLALLEAALNRSKKVFVNHEKIECEVEPLSHQVGGHPMMRIPPNYILKPFNIMEDDDRGLREFFFYEIITFASKFRNCDHDIQAKIIDKDEQLQAILALLKKLSVFIPVYHGINRIHLKEGRRARPEGILLKDITSDFKEPCVVDIKMGKQTYEPNASIEKKRSQMRKYPEQEIFGFRIIGMKIYSPTHPDADDKGFRVFDKSFGRKLSHDYKVQAALRIFFQLENPSNRDSRFVLLVEKILQKLNELSHILIKHNDSLAFTSSSILIVYEGEDIDKAIPKFTVNVIDFAHIRYEAEGDDGFIHGINTLKKFLNTIRRNT